MIARIWHGLTMASKSDEYLDYLNQTGIPEYRATDGNRGVYILRRVDKEGAHFLLISLWESFEKIGNFAGDDVTRAKYYPEDDKYLLELEPTVQHFEVVVQP